MLALPDYTAVAVAGFSVGPMILLLANHFVPWIALLAGLSGAVLGVLWYGLPDPVEDRSGAGRSATREAAWTLGALLFVLAWIVANCFYSSQDVFAIRDPSTYAIAGRWLWDHTSLRIDTMPQVFGVPPRDPGLISDGFNNIQHSQIIYAQGNHLLPVLLGLTGKFLGLKAMFAANTVIGGAALYVFFGLARRICGSAALALFAAAALALSIPYLYTARDTFSEPLTMLFLLGGLALIQRAWAAGSPRQFALAGFVGACSAMVRVDSYAGLVGFVASAALVAMVAPPGARRRGSTCALALVAGGLGPTFLGWVDVAWLSRQYYWSQHHNITALIALLFVLVVACPVLTGIAWLPALQRRLGEGRNRTVLANTMAGLVLLTFVILVSRPLWYYQTHKPFNPVLAALQKRSGVKSDGLATYGQDTVTWQAWYFGWCTVVLAGVGYAILVRRFIAQREYRLCAALGTGMAMSVLYLWNPQIYPDQPWAMRRYVPVIIPMLLVASIVAIRAVAELKPFTYRPLKVRWTRTTGRVLTTAVTALLVFYPLVITVPVWTLRQEYPQYAQLSALCRVLPQDAAVIEVDAGAQIGYAQTLRTYCHIPTYALIRQPDEEADVFRFRVARVYAATRAHGYALYTLSTDSGVAPLTPGTSPQPFSTVWTYRWPTQISQVPHGPVRPTDVITVHLGRIDARGYAHPVTGGPLFRTAGQQRKAGY